MSLELIKDIVVLNGRNFCLDYAKLTVCYDEMWIENQLLRPYLHEKYRVDRDLETL